MASSFADYLPRGQSTFQTSLQNRHQLRSRLVPTFEHPTRPSLVKNIEIRPPVRARRHRRRTRLLRFHAAGSPSGSSRRRSRRSTHRVTTKKKDTPRWAGQPPRPAETAGNSLHVFTKACVTVLGFLISQGVRGWGTTSP